MHDGLLTDTLGRRHTVLRLSLTERCNLRCRYCMPAEGVALSPPEHLLTNDEVVRLARLFVEAGVEKIRLTGGEPLLRPGVERLAARLGALPGLEALALTTNGLLLEKKLAALRAAGLRQLNLSLDTLRPDRFRAITRRDGLPVVLRALDAALEAGCRPLKVNCVVVRGINDDEVLDFAALAEQHPVEVRFIEYMPFAGNGWDARRLVPYRELLGTFEAHYGTLERVPGAPSDTAQVYRAQGMEGRLGFIASMTEAFCRDCNRLRLMADGALKVCLFGAAEVNLRGALRAGASDADLAALVAAAVARKQAAHAGLDVLPLLDNRPMVLIGG